MSWSRLFDADEPMHRRAGYSLRDGRHHEADDAIAALALKLPWVVDIPVLTRFIGAAELLGAIRLILPSATRIKPFLTPLAAGGLVVVMVLALAFHASRGELGQAAPINLVLGGFAAFVAWGRTKRAPIAPR